MAAKHALQGLLSRPATRDGLHGLLKRQVEQGCWQWEMQVRSREGVILGTQRVRLGEDGVAAIVAEVVAFSEAAKPHMVKVWPVQRLTLNGVSTRKGDA